MKRMTTKTGDGVNSDSLRARAEELLRANPPSIDPNAPEHVQALVYELYLTQVELKLQVEDWRQAKEAAEHSRNRYQELYDHAPVGYLTLDETGLIVEANTMSTELLGQERDVLKGQDLANFIAPDSQVLFRAFMKNVTQTAMHKTCELRLKRTDGSVLDAQLECRAEKDPKHEVPSLHMTIIDITPLKQVEQRLRNINDTLERRVAQAVGYTKLLGDVACIANESDTVDEAFTACLELICGHVGWSGSHIWMVSQNQITDSGIWSSSPSQAFSAIIKATSAIVERERLPELWAATESRKPASITDPQDDPRNQAIRSAGFAATLLLPVLAGHRVVAVLEFSRVHILSATLRFTGG